MSPLLGGIEEVRKGTSGRQGTDPGLKRRRGERDKPISVKSEKKQQMVAKPHFAIIFRRDQRERGREERGKGRRRRQKGGQE